MAIQDHTPGPIERRRLVFFSLLAGLTALVPVPFLDDALKNRVRTRLVRETARLRGVHPDPTALRWLAVGPPRTLTGCLRGCATGAALKVVFYVIKKLLRSAFRKLVYVLAIKDASDTVSITFHHAWLIDRALALGHLEAPGGAPRIRAAIEQVSAEVDPRPLEAGIRSLFRGSKATLKRAARLLVRSARRSDDDEGIDERSLRQEEELLADVVDDLEAQLAGEDGHLERLARRYEAAHRAVQPADPAEAGASP